MEEQNNNCYICSKAFTWKLRKIRCKICSNSQTDHHFCTKCTINDVKYNIRDIFLSKKYCLSCYYILEVSKHDLLQSPPSNHEDIQSPLTDESVFNSSILIPNPSSQILNYNPATDFSIKQEIGRGSFSIIYKASSRKTGEDLALKRMHPRTQKEKNVFLNEINITFQCNHPNIIQYHSAYDYEGHLYVFEELMSTSLFKILIPDCSLPEHIINYILTEVLKGLEYLHRTQRIHRDIKSDNILLDKKGNVKLADLGFAAQLTEERSVRDTLVGTPCWIAPEIINREMYGSAVDIWSVGIVLIEMLEGVPPNMHKQSSQIMAIVARQGAGLSRPERVKDEYLKLVDSCLQFDPRLRKTAGELSDQEVLKKSATKEEAARYFARF